MNLALFSSTMDDQQSKQHLLTIEKQYIDLLKLMDTKLKLEKETAVRNWLSTINVLAKFHQDLYQKLDSSGQDIRIIDVIIDWENTLETPYTNYLKSYIIIQKHYENLLYTSIKTIIKHLPTTSPFNSINTLLAAPFDQLKLYKSIISAQLDSSHSSEQGALKKIIHTIDTILKQNPQHMVNLVTSTDLISFQKYVDSENVIDLFTGNHLDYQLRSRPGNILLQDEFLLLADNNDQPAQRIYMVLTTDILMVCRQKDESTGRYDLLYPPLAVNDIFVQPLMLDRELIGEYTLQFTVLSKNLAVRAESREVRNTWTGVPLTTTAKNANKTSIPLMNVVRLSQNSQSSKNGATSNTKLENGRIYNNMNNDDDDSNGTPASNHQYSLVDMKSLPSAPAHLQQTKKGDITPLPKDFAAPVINIGLHEEAKINNFIKPISKDHHNVKQRGSSSRPVPSNLPHNTTIESKPLPVSSSSRNRNTGSASQNHRPQMNTPPQTSNRNTQHLSHQQHHHSRSPSPRQHQQHQQHQHRSSSYGSGAGNTQPHSSANGYAGSRSTMSSQPRSNTSHHGIPSQQRPPPPQHHQSQARASQHYQPHQKPTQPHQNNHRPTSHHPPHHRQSHHPQSHQRPPSSQNYHSQQKHPQQRPPQHYQPQYRPPPPLQHKQQHQRPPPSHHHQQQQQQQQPRPRPPQQSTQTPMPVSASTSKPLPQKSNVTPAIAAVVSPLSPSASSQRPMPPTPPPQKHQSNAGTPNPDGGSQLQSPPNNGPQESSGSLLRLAPEDLATPPRSPNPYNNQTNGIRQVIFRNQQCEVFRWNDESWYAVEGQCLLEVRQTFTNRSCIAIRVQTTGELYLNAWVLPQTQIRLASPTDVSLGLVMGSQQETYLVHFENTTDATELNQVLQKMHHAAVTAADQQTNDGQRTLRGDPPTEMLMMDDEDDDDIEGTTVLSALSITNGIDESGATLGRSSSLMQSGQDSSPIPQTLQPAMQCKCKLFVQNEHSNWSSFGSVQLVVSLQVPSRRMHIQIDHDKKRGFSKIISTGPSSSPATTSSSSPSNALASSNSADDPSATSSATSANTLVSATVYSNNVERLGAKRISFLLVNERERTSSMVYMVQLREEESGNTLYDYLKIKNAQNGW